MRLERCAPTSLFLQAQHRRRVAVDFESLHVDPTIRAALATMGYTEATPVQEQGIPPLLQGRDVLLEAQTGSGKTAAFGIPAVVAGSRGPGVRVIVLVPTRELARQVAEELRALGTGSPFRCVAITGGVHAEKEERTLHGDVRCIVATPGRLLALMETQRVKTDKLELVILDEGDRMLDMGFRAEIEKILDATTNRKQTALVSATLPKDVIALSQRHLKDPLHVHATPRALPASLTHYRLNVFPDTRERALVALLRQENPERAIVFVRTRERAAKTSRLLKQLGFAADALQGEMTHEQRRHVFDLFSRGSTRILVATDIASRGLDVPEMQLVVNLDLPEEKGAYTHRAGRAARLGREGRVVSLVLPHEKNDRIELERETGGEWAPYKLDPKTIEATKLPSDDPPPKPKPRFPTTTRAAPTRKPAPKPTKADEKTRAPRAQPAAKDENVPPSRKTRTRRR